MLSSRGSGTQPIASSDRPSRSGETPSSAPGIQCDRLCGSVARSTRGCRSKESTASEAAGTPRVLPGEEGPDPERIAGVPP